MEHPALARQCDDLHADWLSWRQFQLERQESLSSVKNRCETMSSVSLQETLATRLAITSTLKRQSESSHWLWMCVSRRAHVWCECSLTVRTTTLKHFSLFFLWAFKAASPVCLHVSPLCSLLPRSPRDFISPVSNRIVTRFAPRHFGWKHALGTTLQIEQNMISQMFSPPCGYLSTPQPH